MLSPFLLVFLHPVNRSLSLLSDKPRLRFLSLPFASQNGFLPLHYVVNDVAKMNVEIISLLLPSNPFTIRIQDQVCSRPVLPLSLSYQLAVYLCAFPPST